MGRLLVVVPLLALLAGMLSAPAAADSKRVALVIGNSAYQTVPALANPANDARLIADTLRRLGFTVVGGGAQVDLDKQALSAAVQAFGRQLAGAEVGLFYYAGHGVQVGGANYLVPVDAEPKAPSDIPLQMVDANLVLTKMEEAGTKFKIMALDACRNNPFAGRDARGLGRNPDGNDGLAQMQAPKGTIISFATAPEHVAQDGHDGHSPYTRALADSLAKPGLAIFQVFNDVGLEVYRATDHAQQPWLASSPIEGDFYFVPPTPASLTTPGTAGPAGPSGEEVAWGYLKTTNDAAALRKFLSDFPATRHRDEAEARIDTLEQEAAAAHNLQLAALPPASDVTPVQVRTLKAKSTFKECEHCPVMVAVQPGTFMMGSPPGERGRKPEEGPQQQITIGKLFAVGRSEVSFEEWTACVTEGGCNRYRPDDNDWGKGTLPVINVSWDDAQAYVQWLSKKTGAPYRLLSEAEREYVARGCTAAASSCASQPFWFGADISRDHANYDSRFTYAGSPNKAQPHLRTVATDASEENPFGLLHVLGNVSEWVQDCWNPTLAGQPADGSARTMGDCASRVIRGGSWKDHPEDLRSARRSWEKADERDYTIGFRVARDLQN